MKIKAVALATGWLFVALGASAEEPYRTDIQITGKENGPYKIGAQVKPKSRPYKMDRSKDITNEDLSRILTPFVQMSPLPMDRMARQEDVKRALDDMDKPSSQSNPQSVGAHPHTTAPIQDTVEEIDADPIETAGYEMSDQDYRNLDASIAKARSDMQEALDRISGAKNEQDRQQAMRDYEGAKQRLQDATNAAP